VKEVASNRRVLGPDGKVKFTRTRATKTKEARDAPEGLIRAMQRGRPGQRYVLGGESMSGE